LTPAQLKRELRRIRLGWQGRLADKLGVWPSEVRDWLAGKEPVPEGWSASDIRHLPFSQSGAPPPPAFVEQDPYSPTPSLLMGIAFDRNPWTGCGLR